MNNARYYNMDLVRYVLALAVIIAHFNLLSGSDYYWPISSATAVGVFFGLSGFLVYASYLKRPEFKSFIFSRMRRILPAYWFIVLISAFGLCVFSTLSITEYFTNGSFWKYLISNILFLNFLEPNLPGVFTDSEVTCVNGSLWTLKVEWMLYISIPLSFYLIKRYKWNVNISILILFIISYLYKFGMDYAYEMTGREIFHILSYQFVGQFMYFYAGVLIHHNLELFRKNWVFILALSSIGIITHILEPIALVAFFIALSILPSVAPRFTRALGNYSYEMYLFHFPILQIIISRGYFSFFPREVVILISILLIYMVGRCSYFIINSIYNFRNT